MTAYRKDETIYAEIEKAISNIRDLDLTQFDQNLRNQQLTDPPFNLSSSDLVRLLIYLESRFSVYVEYSSIENLGFNILRNSPHEAEVGSNSIEAMTRGGYWS